MKITQTSVAGTYESSDVVVYVSPADSGIKLELKSTVIKQFDTQIRETINDVLAQLGVTAVSMRVEDNGALDCVLRARVKAALLRASDEQLNWEVLL